ncbi:membrane associated [Cryptosporidium sp. chipmunk genotype I]|uniref:membrane associated n=1 Tax=Cryptosporidium sp. chipmunk genotype I TaxID=1280935 RepID=UPI00351A81E9|nr:membrane associated [Cryptosporidium sp. chipmunk genotype I]
MVQVDNERMLDGIELREGGIKGDQGLERVNKGHSGLGAGVVGLKDESKTVLNARRGLVRMVADIILGNDMAKQYKQGSAAYLIDKIQKILRLISLVFSLLILIFIVTSRINKGRRDVSGSFPVGSLGRPVKFEMMLDTLESERRKLGGVESTEEKSKGKVATLGGKGIEDQHTDNNENLEDFNSEILDDPEYWADDNDRDLWEDDIDEYYDMEIVGSENDDNDEDFKVSDAANENGKVIPNESNSQVIQGKRNKGLRSKGVEISLPSSLTLYGRVTKEDAYINGVYNIIIEQSKDGKKYPKLHHGRAIYKKEGKANENITAPTLFIIFDGTHEFWTITSSLDSGSKPLAFLPDHALIPIRHVGPYGAHSNSTWVFRNNNGILKDSSVRIVENSSIEFPRIPVHITKATHNWHIKHHRETRGGTNSTQKNGSSSYTDVKVFKDPYK